jgi:hypothetical protein
MNQLVPFTDRAPALIAAVGERASYRFLEFFTANIRNPHTRRRGILRLALLSDFGGRRLLQGDNQSFGCCWTVSNLVFTSWACSLFFRRRERFLG